MKISTEKKDVLIINYERIPKIFKETRIFLYDIVSISMVESKRKEEEVRWIAERKHRLVFDFGNGNEVIEYAPDKLEECKRDYEEIYKIWYEYKNKINEKLINSKGSII